MPVPAIRVEGLGKRYRLVKGGDSAPYQTFREALIDLTTAPWRRLRSDGLAVSGPLAEFWALQNVSFEVQPGEVLGIIGRNGAGKSTLLKILSRITKPTTGTATIRGRIGSLLEVGTGFHPELTGRENIFLNGSILGMSRKEISRHFDEIVDFAGIGPFLDTPVKRYSSGMYVRLAFAVAAHLNPEILIIDEVLAVGDIGFRRKCLTKMAEVKESGRTILYVSHQLDTVRSLCSRAIILQAGEIIMQGTVNDVIAHYIHSGLHKELRVVNNEPGITIDKIHVASRSGVGHDGPYSIREEIDIVADCRIADCQGPIYGSLHVQHTDGTDIIFSRSAEESGLLVSPEPNDNGHRFIATIPARSLAPGVYNLLFTLNYLSPFRQLSVAESVSALELTDVPELAERRIGPWRGLTSVPVRWRHQCRANGPTE